MKSLGSFFSLWILLSVLPCGRASGLEISRLDAQQSAEVRGKLQADIKRHRACDIPNDYIVPISRIYQLQQTDTEVMGYAYKIQTPPNKCPDSSVWVYVSQQDLNSRQAILFNEAGGLAAPNRDAKAPLQAGAIRFSQRTAVLGASRGDQILSAYKGSPLTSTGETPQAAESARLGTQVGNIVRDLNTATSNQPEQQASCYPNCKPSNPQLSPMGAVETCKPENRYLEHHFNNAKEPDPSGSYARANPSDAVAMCISKAQQVAPGPFASCPSPNGAKPSGKAARPCLSESYRSFVAQAYKDVTSCMGIHPNELLPLIAHESGFHANSLNQDRKSGGGGGGFGQFVQIGIKDVNINAWKDVTKQMDADKCKDLKPILTRLPDPPSKRCDVMVPPKNGVLNMVYTVALHQLNKKRARTYLRGHLRASESQIKAKGLTLSEQDQEKVRTQIAFLAHNIGPDPASTLFGKFFRAFILNPKRTQADMKAETIAGAFREYLGSDIAPPYAGRPKTFLKKVQEKAQELDDKAGGKGTCSAY